MHLPSLSSALHARSYIECDSDCRWPDVHSQAVVHTSPGRGWWLISFGRTARQISLMEPPAWGGALGGLPPARECGGPLLPRASNLYATIRSPFVPTVISASRGRDRGVSALLDGRPTEQKESFPRWEAAVSMLTVWRCTLHPAQLTATKGPVGSADCCGDSSVGAASTRDSPRRAQRSAAQSGAVRCRVSYPVMQCRPSMVLCYIMTSLISGSSAHEA
jgi:hypothetical protein